MNANFVVVVLVDFFCCCPLGLDHSTSSGLCLDDIEVTAQMARGDYLDYEVVMVGSKLNIFWGREIEDQMMDLSRASITQRAGA